MKERIKWIIVGSGFMVGIQALTTLMFALLIQVMTNSPGTVESDQWAMVIFGLTLGAFLFGGFVIGRVEEKPRMYDAIVAAALALLFSTIVYQALPAGARDQFTGSKWLADAGGHPAPLWLSLLQMIPALSAAALGAYLGFLMTSPLESALERFVGFIGVTGSFVGVALVFLIGSLTLPWYLLIALLLVITGGIGLSYRLFHRGGHALEEMTILPHQRRS
jgi:hypothetical protein